MVSLNGEALGNATDQFLRYIYPVTLKPSGNVLSLSFGAALKIHTAGRYTRSGQIDWAPKMVIGQQRGQLFHAFQRVALSQQNRAVSKY